MAQIGVWDRGLICRLTLGGGIGFLSGQYGMVIDNLLGATVVLANGDIVQCDSESHADVRHQHPCSRSPGADCLIPPNALPGNSIWSRFNHKQCILTWAAVLGHPRRRR